MPHFKIAHLHEQGQDMVIIPFDSCFGHKTISEQHEAIAELQMRSVAAGLKGKVVPVWESGGRMAFIAPPQWHSFFRGISLSVVLASINKELSW